MSAELVLEEFLEPIGLRHTDLGVTIGVDAFLADSWSTRVRFRVDEAPFPYTVCAATLLPSAWDDEAQESVSFPPLELVRVEPDLRDPQWAWMLFGACPTEAPHVHLVITRLQVPPSPGHPDVYYNVYRDPFDPMDDDLADRLEQRAGRKRGHEYELPPQWEAMGRWVFAFTPSRRVPPARRYVGARIEVGPFRLEVPWIDRGAAGTLIALDFVPPAAAAWGVDWRWRALEAVRHAGDVDGLGETSLARLSALLEGESVRGLRSGPYGPLGVRHYLELSPILSRVVPSLAIEELQGLRLPEPVEHAFVPRTYEQSAACEIPLDGVDIAGSLGFEIVDIHEDESCFVMAYRLDIHGTDLLDARLVRPILIDDQGYENICQAEGLHELVHAVDWTAAQDARRGFLFPPVDAQREVVLRFETVDVTLARPLVIRLEAGPGDTAGH